MKIIIDKETLTKIYAADLALVSDCDCTDAERAVNIILETIGYVPIPENHGRIVDVNKMEYLKALHDAKYGRISWSEAIKQIKNSAPALLEATYSN